MAKLGGDQATAVENAVNPNGLIDEGIYLATLTGEVKVFDGKSVMWIWPFTIDAVNEKGEPQPFAGRKVDHKTWISDAANYRLKDTFEAFGVPVSTDTDDLLNHKVRVKVTTKDDWKGDIDDETGLVKLVNDVKDVLHSEGPTGTDEAAKARRVKRQEEAKAALAEAGGAAAADAEPMF